MVWSLLESMDIKSGMLTSKRVLLEMETMKMEEAESLTAEEKKRDLYLRQKELLATLLEHGAISQAQHDKSLGDLTEKMGMQPSNKPND